MQEVDTVIVQPEVNIGTIGHVDNGKSTLVEQLTGKFPDDHSEEQKRGISIRLGYADASIYKCESCEASSGWSVSENCEECNKKNELVRKISFVDAPGHEILMATMLSGAAIMDGAILVIAANESCPQPQTREHLAAMEILGIDQLVIVQNKVELVTREEAIDHYKQIKEFVKGTIAENAPIIPISAIHGANVDILIESIQKEIPTPPRDQNVPAIMGIARSFEINRPGTDPAKLMGGVIGGSITQGTFKVGDEVKIVPGIQIKKDNQFKILPISTKVTSLSIGNRSVTEAKPGGLLGMGTMLDPSLTKVDSLAGNIVVNSDFEPKIHDKLEVKVTLLKHIVGSDDLQKVTPLILKEKLLLSVGTATTIGVVEKLAKKKVYLALARPVAIEPEARIAISRRVQGRYRLIGYGIVD